MASEPGQGDPSSKRRFGRVVCQEIRCSLGVVENLSAGGMRIRTSSRTPEPGSTFTLCLNSLDGELLVPCRVSWKRRVGFFKHVVGVQFVNLPEDAQRAITNLARSVVYNETVLPDIEKARRAG
jgi:hypothetical protein